MNRLQLAGAGVEWREVDGEVIALERERAEYLGVNRSGTLLWRALEAGADQSQLADLLVRSYGVSAEAARADVSSFVGQLRARGLLRTG